MEFFGAIVFFLLTVVAGSIGAVLGSDLGSYIPRLATNLVIRAARKLPPEYQERYAEEWLAMLREKEERAGMLWHALGCCFIAAPEMNNEIRGFRFSFYGARLKRFFDVALVLLSAPFVLPVVLLLGFLVRRDGGSALYTQDRVGLNGRIFRIYKLRTMVMNADATLAAHLAADPVLRAEWDENQKLKNDPRITAVGQLLRKTSLDELPQLLNVLTGDMSLVGPRPMMPDQQALYPGRAYYWMRPGLTGPWQVSDRDTVSFAGRAEFDAAYARNLSLMHDIKLMFLTVWVVVRGTGY